MVEGLLELPWVLAVSILVALSDVAILMIPWFRFVLSRRFRILSCVGALVLTLMAVMFADLSFTRWALYDGGHGRSPESAPMDKWLSFVAINAIIATIAGIVGGLLGLVVALLIERWYGGNRHKTGEKSTTS